MATRAATPFLSLEAAIFRLGDRLIFQNTSWVFRHGEQWAVLGPNGSGKSLFADCLRGQLPLVGGKLEYKFRAPAGLSPEDMIGYVAFEERRREVHGAVAQSRWNSIEEEGALLVREHLSYDRVMEINPFEVRGDDHAARARFVGRLRRAARVFEIEPFLERTLLSLSNGERQRVELARGLCRPLRLLILDEPLAGLDYATRQHFGRALERLMATPLRVLFISARAEDLPRHVTHELQVRECRIVHAGPRTGPSARERLGRASSFRYRCVPRAIVAGKQTTIDDPPPGSREVSPLPVSRPLFRKGGERNGVTSQPRPKTSLNQTRALVELRDVTVRYGNNVVLNHLNWTIRPGESWALLGPNGSGKSTILGLILGDHPQAYVNDVIVFGKKRGGGESIWEVKRRIGWVSPELQTHFSQEATCFEVAASGFFDSNALYRSPALRQRQAALAWLKRFELLPFANAPLYVMSAGLQRMALLARALVRSPELLLLDEPCQGLDRAHRRLFINTVDELIRESAATVIYVTHREEEIPRAIRRAFRLP